MLQGFMLRMCSFQPSSRIAIFLMPCVLATWLGCAHNQPAQPPAKNAPASAVVASPVAAASANPAVRAEQIRTDCINGRRLICGRVLKVLPDGLVVDSGYTDLVRPPLTQSWVIPGSVTASRNPNVLELNEPETPCIGLAFLTDVPKRQKVKVLDYVVIMGYPAGHYVYTPVPNVQKNIRMFATGLDSAVKLSLAAEKTGMAPSPAPTK
jgi:hypothetical protein